MCRIWESCEALSLQRIPESFANLTSFFSLPTFEIVGFGNPTKPVRCEGSPNPSHTLNLEVPDKSNNEHLQTLNFDLDSLKMKNKPNQMDFEPNQLALDFDEYNSPLSM